MPRQSTEFQDYYANRDIPRVSPAWQRGIALGDQMAVGANNEL